MADPWFVEAFRADYVDVYAHRDLHAARPEAAYLVSQGLRGLVLDLCCGYGRHVVALRSLGVRAIGIDLSRDLLRKARGLDGLLACADARSIPVRDASLDGVASLFSSFGYFGEDGDRRVLSEVARALAPGGFFALDLMNPAHVRTHLVPRTRDRRGNVEIEEVRALEDGGRRVVKTVSLRSGSGGSRTWREDVRLYETDELIALLAVAGLETSVIHGGFDASPFASSSERRILWARRR